MNFGLCHGKVLQWKGFQPCPDTRLARRRAVYYHRAAIPQDIKANYPKAEEVFSLKTKDYAEALRRVRLAAVEVDGRFQAHRRKIALERAASLMT